MLIQVDFILDGGNFEIQQIYNTGDGYRFTLNCLDENYNDGAAYIEVNSGKFVNFNPQDNQAYDEKRNFINTYTHRVNRNEVNGNIIYTVVEIDKNK